MGLCLAPIIPEIVLEHLFEKMIPQALWKPTLFYSYVDDIIASIPEHLIDNFVATLHLYDENLRFTAEKEVNNTLPYLDMILIRKDQRIITNWYSKPTSSNNILNFLSNHPHKHKINVASNLVHRVLSLSDIQFWHENIDKITNILQKNNYPQHIIKRVISKNIHTPSSSNSDNNQLSTPSPIAEKRFVSMIYIKGLSVLLKALTKAHLL